MNAKGLGRKSYPPKAKTPSEAILAAFLDEGCDLLHLTVFLAVRNFCKMVVMPEGTEPEAGLAFG